MNPGNLKIELDARLDKHDKIFHLGKIKFPGVIDLSQSLTILAFTAEDGDEEIQLAVNDKENSTYSKVKREQLDKFRTRLKIPLDARQDQFKQTFYVCKVNCNAVINCFSEVVFLLYTSKKGNEEIQIVGDITETIPVKKDKNPEIEITRKIV